jgi:tRNA(fMet)-specific endonuclease VapC
VKFLLDTRTVSDYLRGVDPVVRRIQKAKPSELAISAVTAMELRYGAARRQSTKLTAAVDGFLGVITQLPFDSEAAEQAGILRAAMDTKGHSIALADCQIAATALVHGLILVSSDTDLKRVPKLKIVDWREMR